MVAGDDAFALKDASFWRSAMSGGVTGTFFPVLLSMTLPLRLRIYSSVAAESTRSAAPSSDSPA